MVGCPLRGERFHDSNSNKEIRGSLRLCAENGFGSVLGMRLKEYVSGGWLLVSVRDFLGLIYVLYICLEPPHN